MAGTGVTGEWDEETAADEQHHVDEIGNGERRFGPQRRMALSMRWLREAANKRSEKSMPQRLGGELLEAAESRGGAMKKRDEVHRMAEANKAFSHFRF